MYNAYVLNSEGNYTELAVYKNANFLKTLELAVELIIKNKY